MYDKTLLLELFDEIDEAIRRIERRFSGISTPSDFTKNDDGLDRLDAIVMMLISMGENIKRIDKMTAGTLLPKRPEIQWPGVKGVRDLLAHDYFDIDAEEIYTICSRDLAPLKSALRYLRGEIG
jgi:uncharacterized protein with HEPN domain